MLFQAQGQIGTAALNRIEPDKIPSGGLIALQEKDKILVLIGRYKTGQHTAVPGKQKLFKGPGKADGFPGGIDRKSVV